MRVVMLDAGEGAELDDGLAESLSRGLGERGHDVTTVRGRRPPELLRRRSFDPAFAAVPALLARLLLGRFDVAHALSHADAWAALQAHRAGGPPLVYTLRRPPTRPWLLGARWRLAAVTAAASGAAALAARTAEAAELSERYLLRPAEVIPAGVVSPYEELYARAAYHRSA